IGFETMHLAKILRRLALLAVLVAAACPIAGHAQDAPPPPPPITAADVDSLLKTIEDPVARQKFVDQLHALVNAQRAVAPPAEENAIPERVASRTLETLSAHVATLGQSIFDAVAFIADAPNFVAWLKLQASNSADRSRMLE